MTVRSLCLSGDERIQLATSADCEAPAGAFCTAAPARDTSICLFSPFEDTQNEKKNERGRTLNEGMDGIRGEERWAVPGQADPAAPIKAPLLQYIFLCLEPQKRGEDKKAYSAKYSQVLSSLARGPNV